MAQRSPRRPANAPPHPVVHRIASAALLLVLAACGVVQSARERLNPPPPPPPPTELPLDVYAEPLPPLPAFVPRPPLGSPKAVAERVRTNGELLEHLRKISADYAGRRMPQLRWRLLVQRIEPSPQGKLPARPGSWEVRVVSSSVRGALTYECELSFLFSGEALRSGRPSELCGWKDS